MANQNLMYGFYPDLIRATGDRTSDMLLDAAGEMAGFRIQAPKTGSIRKIHFHVGTYTSSNQLTVSLQNEDASTGNPDGTQDQTGTVSPVSTGWKSVTLGSDRSVTRGDVVWIVIEWTSTAGSLVITCCDQNQYSNFYPNFKTAGTWSKQTGRAPLVVVEYSDGSFAPTISVAAGNTSAVSFGSGDNPSERGIRFSLPWPVRIAGMYYYGRLTGDTDFVIYDDATQTAQATVSLDKDGVGNTGDGLTAAYFPTPYDISANTVYHAILKPTSATQIRYYEQTLADATYMGALPGGTNIYRSTRNGGSGAFTTTTTVRPSVGLIVEGFSDGAGGGSGGVIGGPNMRAGMMG